MDTHAYVDRRKALLGRVGPRRPSSRTQPHSSIWGLHVIEARVAAGMAAIALADASLLFRSHAVRAAEWLAILKEGGVVITAAVSVATGHLSS